MIPKLGIRRTEWWCVPPDVAATEEESEVACINMLPSFWRNKKTAPEPTHSYICQLCFQCYSCYCLNVNIITLGSHELHTKNCHELTLIQCSRENLMILFTCSANWSSFLGREHKNLKTVFQNSTVVESIRKHFCLQFRRTWRVFGLFACLFACFSFRLFFFILVCRWETLARWGEWG